MVRTKTHQPTRKILRLRQLRKGLDMTQGELAQRIGVNKSTIAAYEYGKAKPSFDKAALMASALGHSIEELFEYVEVPA